MNEKEFQKFIGKTLTPLITMGTIVGIYETNISFGLYIVLLLILACLVVRHNSIFGDRYRTLRAAGKRADKRYLKKIKELKKRVHDREGSQENYTAQGESSCESLKIRLTIVLNNRKIFWSNHQKALTLCKQQRKIGNYIYFATFCFLILWCNEYTLSMSAYAAEGIRTFFSPNMCKTEPMPKTEAFVETLPMEDAISEADSHIADSAEISVNDTPILETSTIEWSSNFILADPQLILELPEQLKTAVFPMEDTVLGEWIEEKSFSKEAVVNPINLNHTEKELLSKINYFSVLEKQFREDSQEAKKAVSKEAWEQTAPHSSTLDVIISGRETVVLKQPNSTIFWLLANNYQSYALEYTLQNGNPKTILYYYCKSIDATFHALALEDHIHERKKLFQYLRQRYNDIATFPDIGEYYCSRALDISEEITLYIAE